MVGEVASSNESGPTIFTLTKYAYVCTENRAMRYAVSAFFFLRSLDRETTLIRRGNENELRFPRQNAPTRLSISNFRNNILCLCVRVCACVYIYMDVGPVCVYVCVCV